MRAVVITDAALHVEERPTPAPGLGQVLVRVHAAGINAADLLQRAGIYPAPPGSPSDIPGLELMGVVEQLGDAVDEHWRGARVCAIVGGGAQATHVVVPVSHLLNVPDHVHDPHAGGFAEAFSTAYDALITQARVSAGDRVLISGAPGGVGTAAVQIARSRGAHVTAVVRQRLHVDALHDLGASEVITIDQLTDAGTFDVVLELIGAVHLEVAQHHLAPFARVVVLGVGGGATAQLDLRRVMTTRATFTGSTLRARTNAQKTELASLMRAEILPLWRSGTLHVPLAARFNLDDVAEAYDFFARPGKFGKVVLTMPDS
jgi:NADPH:quinone reductase-like Zn-dependent oxidoreductase